MTETKQVKKQNSKDKDPPGILEWIVDFLVSPIATPIKELLKPIIGHPTDAEKSTLQKSVNTATDHFTGKSSPISVDTAEKELVPWSLEGSKRMDDTWLASVVLEGATLGQVDATVLGWMNNPKARAAAGIWTDVISAEMRIGQLPFLSRSILKEYRPILPEAYRLALAAAKDIPMPIDYIEAMMQSGFDGPWAEVWREQNYEYPPWQTLAELYWRGVIDDKTFDVWMRRVGHPEQVISALKALREVIPPGADLVTMVVREAFDPDWVTPAPEVFAKYMAMKGFGKEWADRYWTMHWVRMPLAQAYDNYYRGYWDEKRLKDELRWADFHPGLHNDIVKVAYGVPSIRELGYGFDVGVYTLEDIERFRRWGGLSPEDADKAAVAMVAYRTEAEREAVRREHMHLYAMDRETRVEFEANLERLGTSPPAIPLWLERADMEKERRRKEAAIIEPRDITRATAQWMFEQGLRDETWLCAKLKDLDTEPSAIDVYIDQSKLRRKEREAKLAEVPMRAPALAQIRSLYIAGKIKAEDLYKFYMDLDYSRPVADVLAEVLVQEVAKPPEPRKMSVSDAIGLYGIHILNIPEVDVASVLNVIIAKEPKPPKTQALIDVYVNIGYSKADSQRLALGTIIDLTISDLRARYSKGWINTIDMFNAILALGVPKERANEIMEMIVKAEQPARVTAEKDLTKAEIIKGVKVGILTTGQGVELLKGIGYDENEAWYLLYINAVVARGDPEGYWEMRKVVEQAKKARGQPSVSIPDELITLELQLKELKVRLEQAKAAKEPEVVLGQLAVDIANVESRMRKIIAEAKIS